MRKTILVLAAVLLTAPAARADQFDAFYAHATAASLKPFARDLGGLLGSATFHSGRVLGFSGFDLGGHLAVQFAPSQGDAVMRAGGDHPVLLPWAQAEIGMPFKIDGFIRGTKYDGVTIAGGGLRYGLLKVTDVPWKPQVLATIVGNSAVSQYFSAGHFGASLVGSMGTQTFTPYVGLGFDRTTLTVQHAAVSAIEGTTVVTFEGRFTAGLQYRPWTFLYASAAYVWLHGQNGAVAGLGLRF